MKAGGVDDQVSNRTLKLMSGFAICLSLLAVADILLRADKRGQLFWFSTDFSNYWAASRLILEGKVQDLFGDNAVYVAHMRRFFGEDTPWRAWSYPPSFLLFIWPLGTLDFSVSMVGFLLLTLLLFLHAVSIAWRPAPDISAFFLAPFIIANTLSGQNGFLTAALLLYGLSLRESRPLLAGMAIGLLTIKPQLGILLPLLLLMERRWSVFMSAAITTIATFALSVWLFGIKAWTGYVTYNWADQTDLMKRGHGLFIDMMVSTFGAMRAIGYDAHIASYVHAAVAFAALLAFGIVVVRHDNPNIRSASLAFATLLISPYALFYDLGAVIALGAFGYTRMASRAGAANDRIGRLAYYLLASLPLTGLVSSFFGFPIMPIVLAGCWWQLVWRQRSRSRGDGQSILSVP